MSLPVYRKDKRLTNGKRIIRACYIILAFLAVFIFRNVSPWSIASRDIPTETDAAVSKNPRKRKPLSSDSDMESIFRVSKSDAFDAFPESLDASMSGVSTSAALTHTNNPDAMLDCIFFTSGDKDVRVSVAKLFDAFSTVAEENKWPYWIAHQDLLAWHWNKRSFTMNPSVSIQIPSRLVPHLLKYENEMIFHRFRIIVNPNHYLLDSQPPKSGIDIDAVFLDTKTGLEIQIHALYKTSTNGMLKTLNGFVYHSSDIFPLRKSEFNNHSVWIPNEPERILLFEYGKNSLYTRYHLNYKFEKQEWRKMKSCREIFNAYLSNQVAVSHGGPGPYPRYRFTRNRFSADIRPTQCVVTEIRKDGSRRKIIANWPLPKLDDDNGRRRLLREH